jgi:hypothetical protein
VRTSRLRHGILAAQAMILTFAAMLAWAAAASASPCRPAQGYRNVATRPLDTNELAFMRQVEFADKARLYAGPPGIESVKGIDAPAERYSVKVEWDKERAVFSLDDGKGHTGTLTLITPADLSIFEIDTRDRPGAAFYKEWKLTGKTTGTGSFKSADDPEQRLSLILQGRGKDCITAIDEFRYWTLVMEGPKADYILFGDLAKPR